MKNPIRHSTRVPDPYHNSRAEGAVQRMETDCVRTNIVPPHVFHATNKD